MTKLWPKKNMGLKKTDSISPKTQHFLYSNFSSIEDHNQTKKPFQTRILHKKSYSKPPNKYPYKKIHTKIHTKVPNKFHTFAFLFSFLLPSSLLFFFFFSFSSLLPYPIFPILKAKNEISSKPCLALS